MRNGLKAILRNCLVEDMCVKISDFHLSREIRKENEKYRMKRFEQNLPIRFKFISSVLRLLRLDHNGRNILKIKNQ